MAVTIQREMTMNKTTHLGQGLTQGQVEDLLQEAAQAGDEKMVAICLDALDCDQEALKQVKIAIVKAEAMARS